MHLCPKLPILFLIVLAFQPSIQDIYLHSPRGSNNRLNEASATRRQNNRLFDSQNNARGGYNVGDATSDAATTEQQQYQMRYFQSGGSEGRSTLEIEWTNQHGCGGGASQDAPTKQNCQLVLQFMCQPLGDFSNDNDPNRMRDGLVTDRPAYTEMPRNGEDENGFASRQQGDVNLNRGLHENWQYYDTCVNRERNGGLFTADQGLRRNNRGYSGAIYTRQNPAGTQSGYECPEERDYWPYWHPSPWKDIAVLTNNVSACSSLSSQSFNVKPKGICVEKYPSGNRKTWSRWNNREDCAKNGSSWVELFNFLEKAPKFTNEKSCLAQSTASVTYFWAVPYDASDVNQKECLVALAAPECKQADWTRSNHLGNSLNGKTPGFQWSLPFFPSRRVQKCVFRIRYNISTDDYDPTTTDSNFNGAKSPVKQDPNVDIGAKKQVLQLAINTNQVGRVFQDRSHTFLLLPRPTLIGESANIINLNVRGKRGNIVQVYPAVEYDFVPTNVNAKTGDVIHIQWTGSNSHNNGQPQGDGEAGNDGQGKDGTDRHNLVQTASLNENFPLPFEMGSMWSSGDLDLVGFLNTLNFTDDSSAYLTSKQALNSADFRKDVALYLASGGFYKCVKAASCGAASYETLLNGTPLDNDLNTAPASLPGVLIRFTGTGKRSYFFMCSRNNNFSNRSQKGAIFVS